MNILGAVVRTRMNDLDAVVNRMGSLAGVDVALNPGDGRLVAVLEDACTADGLPVSAAGQLAQIALWPEVLSTSLVYEYSGTPADAPDAQPVAGPVLQGAADWRMGLAELASYGSAPPG